MFDKMDKSLIYYLSHPCTTYGDAKQNRISSIMIENYLREMYKLHIINPIGLIPEGIDNDIAMEKCKHFYNGSDSIILCDNWEQSKGCNTENRWAVEDRKPIYRLYWENKGLMDYSIELISI
ncbi:MAG: DUF4406 domain-containing protein [Bacillota bacterium]